MSDTLTGHPIVHVRKKNNLKDSSVSTALELTLKKAGEVHNHSLSVMALLVTAKRHLDKGINSLREASDAMASANDAGVSHRHIALAVGYSKTWVTQLLQWRTAGYPNGKPFAQQSQKARNRSRHLGQSTDQSTAVILITAPPTASTPSKITAQLLTSEQRDVFIRALKDLECIGIFERAKAALKVQQYRESLGVDWHDVIANPVSGRNGDKYDKE